MSRLLLSETLPLRTTRMLGDYAESLPLPILIGDLSSAPFPLIRLTDLRFFVADHPAEVLHVFIDKQATVGWERRLESDDQGHTWTVVVFTAPVDTGAAVSATGRGRLDDDTGALIENPADVATLICRLAGRDDDWSGLRSECSTLPVAGRIAETKSIRAHLDAVTQSVGAIWSQRMARLYPVADDPLVILDLDPAEVTDLQAKATTTDTADVLRLSYDHSDASGKPQHYIELTASPQRYNGLIKEVEYGWLRSPANAEAVCRPVLQRLAGERYDVTFASSNRSIRPGMWVRPVAHPEWPIPGDDPVIMVLSVEVAEDAAEVKVAGETTIGRSLVTVTAHSLALPDTVEAGIDVVVRDGVVTFTVTDADGRPLAGARVALDGGAPRTTNAQGKVSFPAVSGVHELAFEAAGYLPLTMQVTL